MSEIRKCTGFVFTYSMDCPLRDNCLRFTMPEDGLFNAYIGPAYRPDNNSCWNLLQSRSVEKRIQAQKGEE